jgi:hypothetical protein
VCALARLVALQHRHTHRTTTQIDPLHPSSLVEACSVPQLKSKRDPFVEEFLSFLFINVVAVVLECCTRGTHVVVVVWLRLR